MFNKIQVVPTLTNQQGSDLYILVLTHMDDIGCICALADHKLGAVKHNMNFKSGLFAISITSVRKFWMGMDSWVEYIVTYLKDNLFQLLFRDLDMVHVTACDKVKVIVVHLGSYNKAT